MSTPIHQPNYINPETRVSLIVGVTISTQLLSILGCLSTRVGSGHHTWDIKPEWFPHYMRLGFAIEMVFPFSVALPKLSLCFTYLRLFPSKANRIFCYCSMAYLTCWLIAIVFTTTFQCIPVNAFWDMSITDKKCIDTRISHTAFAITNSLSDFIVYLWPARALWNMQLPFRQRLGLVLVFCTGAIVCVAGILRMATLQEVDSSGDPNYVSALTWVASVFECNIGIICGCLQGVRPLLMRFFPRIFGSSEGYAANYPSRTHDSHTFPFRTYPNGTFANKSNLHKELETGGEVSIKELDGGMEDENNYVQGNSKGKSATRFKTSISGGGDPGRDVPENGISFSQHVTIKSGTSIPEEASATAPIGDAGSEDWIIPGSGK
ncbi:hypothetical protein K432DRAFT_342074 [Lepidopterella palustris CBS 459.81]|uniref:Rhodopsin domain-containing protein n=1 Tax=Lepidopterella palustris CBS 459.81 TaxID=1314670 RepID=A0A8E2ELI8_9PEZI|nr:hypothetical protein K432DRAFT_342074 [Lepidopterella palustris CBS 459.81]